MYLCDTVPGARPDVMPDSMRPHACVGETTPADGGLDVGGIRGGHLGLCHGKAGPNLALQQRKQPLLLLCPAAIAGQYLHTATM